MAADERGWWGGLLDSAAELPQTLGGLLSDAFTRRPGQPPSLLSPDQLQQLQQGQPQQIPGAGLGGLLNLTPVGPIMDAYKATQNVDNPDPYASGRATGDFLKNLAMIGVPAKAGAAARAERSAVRALPEGTHFKVYPHEDGTGVTVNIEGAGGTEAKPHYSLTVGEGGQVDEAFNQTGKFKGLGPMLYERAMSEANKLGLTMSSSGASPAAQRVWRDLESRGLARQTGDGQYEAVKPMSVDATLGNPDAPRVTFKGKEPKDFAPQDWHDLGNMYGGPELAKRMGPPNEAAWRKSLGSVTTPSGRDITIPGGLDSNEPFTYYDLLHLKSQGIQIGEPTAGRQRPPDLTPEQHQKIHDRTILAMQPGPGGPSDQQITNQLLFGMISPNQPLTPNELALQRAMVKGPEDMQRWAAMRGMPSADIKARLGVQAQPAGGLGVSGSADYGNMADMVQMMRDRPDFFRFDPNAPEFAGMTDAEKWATHATRVGNQVKGLGPKTASLSVVWQDPKNAAISAIDRHMAADFYDRLFPDEAARLDFERKTLESYNAKRKPEDQVASYDAMLGAPGGRGHFVDKVLGYVGNTPELVSKMRSGEWNPRISPALQATNWLTGVPNKMELIEGPYVRALNANAEEAAKVGQSTFANQWMRWDPIRGRYEPHEVLFPGLEQLPRMSMDQMREVRQAHAEAGYFGDPAKKVVQPIANPSRLGYFSFLPAAPLAGSLLAPPDNE